MQNTLLAIRKVDSLCRLIVTFGRMSGFVCQTSVEFEFYTSEIADTHT